jgi:hypothetical protein
MAIHFGGGQGGLEQFATASGQCSRGATISQGTNVSKPALRLQQQVQHKSSAMTLHLEKR